MNHNRFLCLITMFSLFLPQATLAKKAYDFKKPEDVVSALYKDYPIRIDDIPCDAPQLINQPKNILNRYITEELTNMILRDRECVAREQGICNLDFEPFTNTQDPGNLKIKKITLTNKPDTVLVRLTGPWKSFKIDLKYKVKITKQG